MNRENSLLILIAVLLASAKATHVGTAERVASYGFKVETHTVHTSDGYILTLFRIPQSKAPNGTAKPIVFLQHGFTASSDWWILNDRKDALAFMLADAGYDLWMGNSRGNTYSRRHESLTPESSKFWRFSWHEIAIYDFPACIDYILQVTGQTSMHYVGHSQGATIFMVMLSLLPHYNRVFKTTHMLAPVLYVVHMQAPLRFLATIFGQPTPAVRRLGEQEFAGRTGPLSTVLKTFCKRNSPIILMCGSFVNFIGGWRSSHLNNSLVPIILETNPAGSSYLQVFHFFQENLSGKFRQYDFGIQKNRKIYGQSTPPSYPVQNVRPSEPIDFYYSDNDIWTGAADVERFAKELGSKVRMNHIKYPDWNHLDFLWAIEVRTEINEPILKKIRNYERKHIAN